LIDPCAIGVKHAIFLFKRGFILFEPLPGQSVADTYFLATLLGVPQRNLRALTALFMQRHLNKCKMPGCLSVIHSFCEHQNVGSSGLMLFCLVVFCSIVFPAQQMSNWAAHTLTAAQVQNLER